MSFYSVATTDIEYKFPFGWGELWGIADRTDYDLNQHINSVNADFVYTDPITNEKYVPYCVEPSVGVDRMFLTFLCNAYEVETLEDGTTRNLLKLHPALAPYKAAVLPLTKKLTDKSDEVYKKLSREFNVDTDVSGSIGKRYRRQDEAGTPFCITVDFDTLEDETVTVRHRDSMEQERVKIDDLIDFIAERIEF